MRRALPLWQRGTRAVWWRRAELSIALQAGISRKVVKYLSRQVPGHGAPGAAPGVAEEAEVEAAAVAAYWILW